MRLISVELALVLLSKEWNSTAGAYVLKKPSLKATLHLALNLLACAVFLNTAACDKKPYTVVNANAREAGTTGFPSPNGSNYTTGKDERRVQEITDNLAPADPLAPTSEEIQRLTLAQSLNGGRVLRFNAQSKASRFGGKSVMVILKTTDENLRSTDHTFKADLKWLAGRYVFDNALSDKDSSLSLSGSFEDKPSIGSSQGTLILKQESQGVEAHILYRAYLADLTVRTRADQRSNAQLQTDLSELKSYTQAWVNNFVVSLGRSFYDYVLIRTRSAALSPESSLSFSGEAIRTSEEKPLVTNVDSAQATPIQIRLIGDAEEEDQRTFEVTIETASGPEMVMVDIDSHSPPPSPSQNENTDEEDESETPEARQPLPDLPTVSPVAEDVVTQEPAREDAPTDEATAEDAPTDEATAEEAPATEDVVVEEPVRETQPNVPMPVTISPELQAQRENTPATVFDAGTSAFLYDQENIRSTNIDKVHSDIQRNINTPEVQAWIKTLLGQAQAPAYKNGNKDNTDYKRRFLNFLRGAAPFRKLIATIFNHYDLPAAMAYLTINESEFFIAGDYPIQGNSSSTAYGPFQFLKATAASSNVNMKVDESQQIGQTPPAWDERAYFAPSACGAGSYFKYLTRLFENGDRTLAILAYGIGEGAAAAAVTCDSGNDQDSLSTCENRGLYRFSSSDYNKFIRDLSAYDYSFAEVSRRNFVPENFVRYTRKWLAYYAIGQDPTAYGIEVPQSSNAALPTGKVVPSDGVGAIQSSTCREALAGYPF